MNPTFSHADMSQFPAVVVTTALGFRIHPSASVFYLLSYQLWTFRWKIIWVGISLLFSKRMTKTCNWKASAPVSLLKVTFLPLALAENMLKALSFDSPHPAILYVSAGLRRPCKESKRQRTTPIACNPKVKPLILLTQLIIAWDFFCKANLLCNTTVCIAYSACITPRLFF